MIKLELEELFEFYRNEFLPAYSDLVGFTAKKPAQILTENENTLAHISQYFNPSLDINAKEKNLMQAYEHLVSATEDCYKALWVQIDTELNKIYLDNSKNTNDKDFLLGYQQFREQARKARGIEMSGKNTIETIKSYKEAIKMGWNLLKKIGAEPKQSNTFVNINYY